jgi:hypothetical protein
MANERTISLGNQRHGELSGFAQRLDNELFRVARMRGVEKRRNRYSSNRRNIGGALVCNLDFHGCSLYG